MQVSQVVILQDYNHKVNIFLFSDKNHNLSYLLKSL